MTAVAEVADVETKPEHVVLQHLKQAWQVALHEAQLARDAWEDKVHLAVHLKEQYDKTRQVMELGVVLAEETEPDVPAAEDALEGASVTDGVRLFFDRIKDAPGAYQRTATAKDIETWLVQRGYRTHARNFYWSVYAVLRQMTEVVGVVKEGETSRFAWRASLTKAPAGWRLVDFPRRTTAASRKAAGLPKAKVAGR